MAKSKVLYAGPCDRSGISITYVKRRGILEINGWYDGFVGIEGENIPLGKFLTSLGITLKDCEQSLTREAELPWMREKPKLSTDDVIVDYLRKSINVPYKES